MPGELQKGGWDATAIHEIVQGRYGGYTQCFQAHGWPESGSDAQEALQRRIQATYGTVPVFERWQADLAPDLRGAIRADLPNVWLTSYWRFREPFLSLLGFTREQDRKRFLANSGPGALVVIYAAKHPEALRDTHQKVLGLLQVTGPAVPSQFFMSDRHWQAKQRDPTRRHKWNHAVRVGRAWRITEESRCGVREIAPGTYRREHPQNIASRGVRLDPSEAARILDLDWLEVPVRDGPAIEWAVPGPGREVLSPSRPGPVSQAPYTVSEAEGPKHLYILQLQGDESAFLGPCVTGQMIVKVGFSRSPEARCENHSRMLPRGAFCWRVHKSTFREQDDPFPSSAHAIAGEDRMKALLNQEGTSLGGEFFLARGEDVESAWRRGVEAARGFGCS